MNEKGLEARIAAGNLRTFVKEIEGEPEADSGMIGFKAEIPVAASAELHVAVYKLVPVGSYETSATPHQMVVVGDSRFVKAAIKQVEDFGNKQTEINGFDLASSFKANSNLPPELKTGQGLILFLRRTGDGKIDCTVVKRGDSEPYSLFEVGGSTYSQNPLAEADSRVGEAWLAGKSSPADVFVLFGGYGRQEPLIVGPKREGKGGVYHIDSLEKSVKETPGARLPVLARIAKRIGEGKPPTFIEIKQWLNQAAQDATSGGVPKESPVPVVVIGLPGVD